MTELFRIAEMDFTADTRPSAGGVDVEIDLTADTSPIIDGREKAWGHGGKRCAMVRFGSACAQPPPMQSCSYSPPSPSSFRGRRRQQHRHSVSNHATGTAAASNAATPPKSSLAPHLSLRTCVHSAWAQQPSWAHKAAARQVGAPPLRALICKQQQCPPEVSRSGWLLQSTRPRHRQSGPAGRPDVCALPHRGRRARPCTSCGFCSRSRPCLNGPPWVLACAREQAALLLRAELPPTSLLPDGTTADWGLIAD
jgi:hypothetical protein